MVFKYFDKQCPCYLNEVFVKTTKSCLSLRNSFHKLKQPFCKTSIGQNTYHLLILLVEKKFSKGPIKQVLSVLSFYPSFCLGFFLEFYHQFFLNFDLVLETHMNFVTEPDFLEKLPQKLGKQTKFGPKTGFFEFIEKSGHYVLLNLFYNDSLYYFLCPCTNPIFGKIFIPEIWAKMFSVNQIARFFNQLYLQNKSIKQPYFKHVDTNSHKLEVDQKMFEWDSQKWVWPVWSWDSKADCVL